MTGAGKYGVNTQVTISQSAPEDYKFTHWSLGGVQYSAEESFNYQVSSQNVSFVAHYEKTGSVFDPTVPSEPLAKVQIVAEPPEGKYFVSWNDGITDNPRWVLMSEKDNYTAIYADIECQITYGSVEATAEGGYA